MNTAYPRRGWLQFDAWGRRSQTEVEILGRRGDKYRVRALRLTAVVGRRSLRAGETCLVPGCTVKDARVAGVPEV